MTVDAIKCARLVAINDDESRNREIIRKAREEGFGIAIKAVTDMLHDASDGITRKEVKLRVLALQYEGRK